MNSFVIVSLVNICLSDCFVVDLDIECLLPDVL